MYMVNLVTSADSALNRIEWYEVAVISANSEINRFK